MVRLGRWLAALAAACAVVGGAEAGSPVRSETATDLGVKATVSYARIGFDVYYVRLVVERDQQRVYDKRVQPFSAMVRINKPFGLAFSSDTIDVRDLDGDGEPEILLDFWTDGAHCCVWTRIYRWDESAATYTSRVRWWGDVGYELADLGGEESFVSADDRFAYAFSSYAGSGFPIQIWALRSGRLVDVTGSHRPLIARDADQMWRYYVGAKKAHGEMAGLLAAWAADECRLRRGQAALTWLRKHRFLFRGEPGLFVGSPSRFLRVLPATLRRWGYRC